MNILYTYASKTYMMVQAFPGIWHDVLDIGCGDRDLEEYCGRYFGIDILPGANMVAEFPYVPPLEGAETVVMSHVLEHIDELRYTVEQALWLAKRWVVICVPNPFSLNRRWDYLRGRADKYKLPDGKTPQCVYHRWVYSIPEFRAFIRSFKVLIRSEIVIVPKRYKVLGKRTCMKLHTLLGMHYLCLIEKNG